MLGAPCEGAPFFEQGVRGPASRARNFHAGRHAFDALGFRSRLVFARPLRCNNPGRLCVMMCSVQTASPQTAVSNQSTSMVRRRILGSTNCAINKRCAGQAMRFELRLVGGSFFVSMSMRARFGLGEVRMVDHPQIHPQTLVGVHDAFTRSEAQTSTNQERIHSAKNPMISGGGDGAAGAD